MSAEEAARYVVETVMAEVERRAPYQPQCGTLAPMDADMAAAIAAVMGLS